MAKFNKLLDAKFTPPKRWQLDSSLIFDSDKLNEKDKAVTMINSSDSMF